MQSYVFFAGGMGITPFRSIIKHHLAKKEKLNITLFHFVSTKLELLFQDIFAEAATTLGITFVPVLTGDDALWDGERGKFSETLLRTYVSDLQEPLYYLSGSEVFINAVQEVLQAAGISEEQIKTDIFSGY